MKIRFRPKPERQEREVASRPGATVLVGVPVFGGELYLEEALQGLQNQTHRDFEVLISMDGPDPICEAICAKFLDDKRFRLVVQPERLGWAPNISWLMSQCESDFFFFHQQDDRVDPKFLEILVDYALRHPEAAVVHCDIVPFGTLEGRLWNKGDVWTNPSITGHSRFIRQMTLLHDQILAWAFLGLIRANVLHEAGPVPTHELDSLGADGAWVAAAALSGEIHRVPERLYEKRAHDGSTAWQWNDWPKDVFLKAFCNFTALTLEQSFRIEPSAPAMRLIWLAALDRLTAPWRTGHYLNPNTPTPADRRMMLDYFLDRVRSHSQHDLPKLMDATWEEIRLLSEKFFWVPSEDPIEIESYGPNPVRKGEAFNIQREGSSALWVGTSRYADPCLRIRLGGRILETAVDGCVLTARVPEEITQVAASLELALVGLDGELRSQPVPFEVL